MEESPPHNPSTAIEALETRDSEPQNTAPQKPPEKVFFGVRAKPLQVVAKKKTVVPEKSLATPAANGHSHPLGGQNGNEAPASTEVGNASGGLLGLGSYGSESD